MEIVLIVATAFCASHGVAWLMRRRPRWQLVLAWLVAVPICMVAVPQAARLGVRAAVRPDASAAAATLEATMLRASPVLMPILKQEDPDAWRALMADAGGGIAADPSRIWPGQVQAFQTGIETIARRMWGAVANADDNALLALGRQELVLDAALRRENVVACANRGAFSWNGDSLSPASARLFEDYVALIAAAYRQGKGRRVAPLADDEAQALLMQAVQRSDVPMTAAEADLLASENRSDPARYCDARVKMWRMMLDSPDRVRLLRWSYAIAVR